MTWIPYAFREKTPCAHCGTRSYLHEVKTEDGTFCSETCATTARWRKKFSYYERDPRQFPRSST